MKKMILILTTILLTSLLGCSNKTEVEFSSDCWASQENGIDYVRYVGEYFDTEIKISICSDNESNKDIFDDVEAIIKKYHQLSDKRNSYDGLINVYTINNNPEVELEITNELYELLILSKEAYTLSDSLFNIALDPVIKEWNKSYEGYINNELNTRPDIDTLNQLRNLLNLDDLILTETTVIIKPGMSIDLGAMSKGFMVQKVNEYLSEKTRIRGFIIDAGGNISVGGNHPSNKRDYFTVGIEDPIKNDFENYCVTDCNYKIIKLIGGQSIVTSGDYQRYFKYTDDDGTEIKYHHIIDPLTLFPKITKVKSVSVITSNSAYADLYSTIIFLNDFEAAKEFVESIDDLEAIWYLEDQSIHISSNFNNYILE